jgi:putative transposase
MIIRQGFEYWLKVKGRDKNSLLFHAVGCQRFLWNKMLKLQLARLAKGRRLASYCTTAAVLVRWKARYQFLNDVPSQSLQQTLKALDRAFKDGFDKTQPNKRLPVYKKKFRCVDSFRLPQGVRVSNNAVFLPKLGWSAFKLTRPILGRIKNTTIKREGGRWKIVFQTEREVVDPIHANIDDVLALDMGCKHFATDSKGEPHIGPKALQVNLEKLAGLQRQLSTKVKFSLRWKQLKAAIAKLHHRIACIRKDFLNKLSTQLAKSHGHIVLEDLKVVEMTASASGTVEEPGAGRLAASKPAWMVAQKSGLNRSILDQGWGEFRRQLSYKLEWMGGKLSLVPPHYTSQTCPESHGGCGHVSAANRKDRDTFLCVRCGFTAPADKVGAMNILSLGLRLREGKALPHHSRESVSLEVLPLSDSRIPAL